MYLNLVSVPSLDSLDRDFFWPFSEAEKDALYRKILHYSIDLIDSEADPFREQVLRVFTPYFLSHVLTVLGTATVYQRVKKHGKRIESYKPNAIDFFSWLVNNLPLDHRFLDKRIARYDSLRSMANYFFRRCCWRPDDTMLFNSNITAESYRKMQSIPVSRTKIFDWVSPFSRPTAGRRMPASFAMNIFLGLEERVGYIDGASLAKEHLADFISYSLDAIAGLLTYLMSTRMARKVKTLYTASQGAFSTRMISAAVAGNGGQVVTFPHSGGLLIELPGYWTVEQLTATTFFCYTRAEKEVRARQASSLKKKPSACLQVLPGEKEVDGCVHTAGKIKKAYFLSGSFNGDRVFIGLLSEIQRIDLEMQIMQVLLSCGIEVVLKVHRKTRVNTKQTELLKEKLEAAITIDDTPLTELLQKGCDADLYVSENVTGGSLIEVIKTKKPVALFTPHPYLMSPLVAELMPGRAAVFPCWMDKNNRVHFDRTAVCSFLTRQEHRFHFDVVNRFTNSLFAY